MDKNANEDSQRHAKSRTTDYSDPSLPGNKREILERYLIFGIKKAAVFGKPVSGAASLIFILFGQMNSSSPVFGWRFMESRPIPLARGQWAQHNRAEPCMSCHHRQLMRTTPPFSLGLDSFPQDVPAKKRRSLRSRIAHRIKESAFVLLIVTRFISRPKWLTLRLATVDVSVNL
jgi:hypothetical protein